MVWPGVSPFDVEVGLYVLDSGSRQPAATVHALVPAPVAALKSACSREKAACW